MQSIFRFALFSTLSYARVAQAFILSHIGWSPSLSHNNSLHIQSPHTCYLNCMFMLYLQQWHLNNRRTHLGLVRLWQVQLVSMDMVPEALQVFRFTLPTVQPGNQGRTATQGHVHQ